MSDDGWDDDATAFAPAPAVNGFGGGSSGGGRGRGKPESNGFGSGDGFGSSGGGGRGGGGAGAGRGCFKCGEEGHMSRECPQGGGGGGGAGRGCFKCGKDGHMSRECPDGGGGGGGGRGCFKCGEEGHMSRECPQAGGGGGGRGRGCFKCGEEGHMSRECPGGGGGGGGGGFGGFGAPKKDDGGFGGFGAPKKDDGGFGGFGGAPKTDDGFGGFGGGGDKKSGGCYKCGEDGHMARDCPQGGGGGGGGGGSGCFNCGEDGHRKSDCPNPPKASIGPDGEERPPPYVPPAPSENEADIFDNTMAHGINFDKYDYIPVEVSGENKPEKGLDTFEQADLSETLKENIRRAGYTKPTPIQKWAIPIISDGRDLMGCAQTGSGKTAAFLLPALNRLIKDGVEGGAFTEVQTPHVIIIGPTRELVLQIFQEARKFAYGTCVKPVVVYGGTSVGHQLRQVEQGAHMVVGTPGRLLDFINRGKINLSKCKFLILDEADRMLDMGFEPEVRKMVESLGLPPKTERQTLMFSATFPEEIQKLAADFLNDYLFCTVGRVGAANTDITQMVHEVAEFDKRDKLVEILNASGTDRTLVFVETKRNADFLASFLSQSNFPTTSIHGDRQQREREEALRDFKTGRAPVLIATSVAARGLDIPGVKHVVNYNLPSSIQEYVHRIGRTGRCGNTGKATSFFDSDKDGDLARELVKILGDAQQEVPAWLEEKASGAYGSSFGGAGGKFGGRDTRSGGGRGGGEENGGGGGGFGGTSSGFGGGSTAAVNDDEDWD